MTHPDFNEAAWVERLAAALEQVAAEARPSYSPPPPSIPGLRPIRRIFVSPPSWLSRPRRTGEIRSEGLNPVQASHLWVDGVPVEAMAILREHPFIKPGLEGSGENERLRVSMLNTMGSSSLEWLVSCLAKLSIKEGGEEAARRLHRYLTAGANGTVPAYETYGHSRTGSEDAIQPRRGCVLGPLRRRQSGVRPARRT